MLGRLFGRLGFQGLFAMTVLFGNGHCVQQKAEDRPASSQPDAFAPPTPDEVLKACVGGYLFSPPGVEGEALGFLRSGFAVEDGAKRLPLAERIQKYAEALSMYDQALEKISYLPENDKNEQLTECLKKRRSTVSILMAIGQGQLRGTSVLPQNP